MNIGKIKQVRLREGCYAIGGNDNVMATDKVAIEKIGSDYVLDVDGADDLIILPGAGVRFAKAARVDKKGK